MPPRTPETSPARRQPHRSVTLIAAALAAAGLSASLSASQPAKPAEAPIRAAGRAAEFKDPTNAALLYYKIWLPGPFNDIKGPCGEKLDASPAWRPDAELTDLLQKNEELIEQILRATRAPEADFGIEFSMGFNCLLPHLGHMRATARILACDARRCLAAADHDGACERIAAIYRMARHVSGDRTLISSLVSVAIAALANTHLDAVLAANKVSPAGKAAMLDAARSLEVSDAFGTRTALEGERWWTSGYIRATYTGPDAGARFVKEVMSTVQPDVDQVTVEQIRKMDGRQFAADIDRIDDYFDALLDAWGRDDAAQLLKNLGSAVERGDYGIVATALVPAVGRAHAADLKARNEQAAAIRRIEALIPSGR